MTVTIFGVLAVVFAMVAVAGYRLGWRAGTRSAPPPRPARLPTTPQVRVLSSHAYDWETDE